MQNFIAAERAKRANSKSFALLTRMHCVATRVHCAPNNLIFYFTLYVYRNDRRRALVYIGYCKTSVGRNTQLSNLKQCHNKPLGPFLCLECSFQNCILIIFSADLLWIHCSLSHGSRGENRVQGDCVTGVEVMFVSTVNYRWSICHRGVIKVLLKHLL